MASTLNTEILERFQSKDLHMIEDAFWYVTNTVIRRDLQTPTVKGEIRHYSSQNSARLTVYRNDLVVRTSWCNPTTGSCEDTCQMTRLADSKCNFLICSLDFKVNL
jgi:hypothetical protein